MNYDWNWFFSSFSQCAAALIAIIGAFVISRLLGLSEKVNLLKSDFTKLLINHTDICERIVKRDFHDYTKKSVMCNPKIKEIIKSYGYQIPSINDLIENILIENPNLFKIKNAVGEGIISIVNLYNSKGTGPTIKPVGLEEQLWNEKEAINKLESESKTSILKFCHNYDELESLKDSIFPLRFIIIFLMVAFPITVIYPLHFMPVIENQDPTYTFNLKQIIESFTLLKTSMLFSFFAIIDGLFFYFLSLTRPLKRKISEGLLENTEDLRKLEKYSPYFFDEKTLIQ